MKIITAELKAKQGQEAQLKAVLSKLFAHVDKEPGTLLYTLHQDPADAAHFFFYEQYMDDAALQSHSTSDFLKEAGAEMADLLDGDMNVHIYDPIISTGMEQKAADIAYAKEAGEKWVRRDLANRQKSFCMCWDCSKFKPEQDDKGCPIIAQVLQLAAQSDVVLPVWACAAFSAK